MRNVDLKQKKMRKIPVRSCYSKLVLNNPRGFPVPADHVMRYWRPSEFMTEMILHLLNITTTSKVKEYTRKVLQDFSLQHRKLKYLVNVRGSPLRRYKSFCHKMPSDWQTSNRHMLAVFLKQRINLLRVVLQSFFAK